MRKLNCQTCGKEEDSLKHVRRLKGKRLCRFCYVANRNNFRKETIEKAGIKKELGKLRYQESKARYPHIYDKKRLKRERQEKEKVKRIKEPPKIKGSKENKKVKIYSVLTLQERQDLFRILIRRGIDEDEVKERIKRLAKQLALTRKRLQEQGKEHEEENEKIKLLEGLYEY